MANMEELPLNVKIKQEKLTPEREVVKNGTEELLETDKSSEKVALEEQQDKKEIEISK